jgi:hypothetical protein
VVASAPSSDGLVNHIALESTSNNRKLVRGSTLLYRQ